MKLRIILGIVLAVLAFGGGVAGMYLAMPYVAPGRVEATRQHLDSLASAQAERQAPAGDSTSDLARDSSARAERDTLAAMDTTALAGGDSLLAPGAVGAPQQKAIAILNDSLDALQQRLAQRDAETEELRKHVRDVQQTMKQMEARKEQTVELANTLAKLEDRELQEILGRLNTEVLEQLYFEASSRNRRRLLQAMPAARAASFVGRLVSDETGAPQTPTTLSSGDAPDATSPGPVGTN